MVKRTLAMLALGLALVTVGSVGVAVSQGDANAFVVVVHPDNPTTRQTRGEVSDLLLKKTTRWSNGMPVKPVDQLGGSSVREAFSMVVHGRSVDRIKNFWQRKIFSGREVPPPELNNDREVLDFVRGEPGAVGYVGADAGISGVKTVTLID